MWKIIFILPILFFPTISLGATYGTDIFSNGTSSASSELNGGCDSSYAVDDNDATDWCSDVNVSDEAWWKYEFSSEKKPAKINLKSYCTLASGGCGIKNIEIQGSENDSDWITVFTTTTINITNNDGIHEVLQDVEFTNTTSSYKYWRFYLPDTWRNDKHHIIYETELYECIDCEESPTSSSTATSSIEDIKNQAQTNLYVALFFFLEAVFVGGLLWFSWKGVKKLLKLK